LGRVVGVDAAAPLHTDVRGLMVQIGQERWRASMRPSSIEEGHGVVASCW
jgi:hypothetical protein